MNYVVEYVDGEILTSSDVPWRNFPRDKNIKNLGVYDTDELYRCLSGYDTWFFSDEGEFHSGSSTFTWLSRMIAGFNSAGDGELITVFLSGKVEHKKVKLNDFEKQFNEKSFIRNKLVVENSA